MTTNNSLSNNIKPRTNLATYVYQVCLLSLAKIDLHLEVCLLSLAKIDLHLEERKIVHFIDNESLQDRQRNYK